MNAFKLLVCIALEFWKLLWVQNISCSTYKNKHEYTNQSSFAYNRKPYNLTVKIFTFSFSMSILSFYFSIFILLKQLSVFNSFSPPTQFTNQFHLFNPELLKLQKDRLPQRFKRYRIQHVLTSHQSVCCTRDNLFQMK